MYKSVAPQSHVPGKAAVTRVTRAPLANANNMLNSANKVPVPISPAVVRERSPDDPSWAELEYKEEDMTIDEITY